MTGIVQVIHGYKQYTHVCVWNGVPKFPSYGVVYKTIPKSQYRECMWMIQTASYNLYALSRWYIKNHLIWTLFDHLSRDLTCSIVQNRPFCTLSNV